ncbi:MAG: zinc metallopeptidase [Clostridia bacterium]|nr:zinc metallopeptidase [Clostridia bacterium]
MFGHYYYYGFDIYYLIFILPAVIISLIAQVKVKSTFSKYSKVEAAITGAEAARRVLSSHGVTNVTIERVSGNLTDHFDPRTNVIRLSESVYNARTVAAVGVAAHEAGHAVQYAENYTPIVIRNKIVPLVNFASRSSWFILILGVALSIEPLLWAGIALFALTTLFHLITLPVEFNASRRAIETIEGQYMLGDNEANGAKRVLSAAAMTYVAALLVSLAQLLRFIMIFGRNRNRRNY